MPTLAEILANRKNSKIEESEKITHAESTQDALKIAINTNIKGSNEKPAMAKQMGAIDALREKMRLSRANFMQRAENPTSTLAIPSTPAAPTVQLSMPKTLAERIALQKAQLKEQQEQKPEGQEPTTTKLDATTTKEPSLTPIALQPITRPTFLQEKVEEKAEAKVEPKISVGEGRKTLAEILAAKKALSATLATEVISPIEKEVVQNKLVTLTEGEQLVEKEIIDSLKEERKEEILRKEDEEVRESFSLSVVLNDRQQAAVDMAKLGKSYVLLGAAGTGKTTSERSIVEAIGDSGILGTHMFKKVEAPSIAIVGYTRRAVGNSKKAIHRSDKLREQFPNNIVTIHELLEFQPETYWDAVAEEERFRFAPIRTRSNPLTITHLIIEEATLVGLDLWEQLYEALPEGVQIIFVGDINQLPPVFGPSILNYALTRLPVIELNQVYRQAEGSPIIANAHRILRGDSLEEGSSPTGFLKIVSGNKAINVGQAKMSFAMKSLFGQMLESGDYNPNLDMILSPWNKHELGTDHLNKIIAEHLSMKEGRIVFEIIVSFYKIYLAVGDKVMVNKRDAKIVNILPNKAYVGKQPRPADANLTRFGNYRGSTISMEDELEGEFDYSDFSVENEMGKGQEKKQQSSHTVVVEYEGGYTESISAVGDLSPQNFSLGYAMTVHKSQGSEWRNVYIIFHKDHKISLSREMLYTAITRAQEGAILIAKKDLLDDVVHMQRVKGNTLEDKILYFNSIMPSDGSDNVQVTK